MRTFLGFLQIIVTIWGIIAFWGTPWSIVALIILAIELLVATYLTGKQQQSKEIEDRMTELATLIVGKEDKKEKKNSVFENFFKKDENEK